jgi:branched-chain amino acid transport system substrate-binding protein
MVINKVKIVGVLAFVFVFIVVLGFITLNANSFFTFSQGNQGVIKFGVIASSTGVGSYQAQQELRGVNFAVDEINAKGGINGKKIELIVEDSKTNPADAVIAIQKLVSIDKVNFVIGDSWNSTTAVIVPITNESKVLVFSPVTTLSSLSKDDYFFRTIPSVDVMMSNLAVFAYIDLNIRRVSGLVQATPYGEEHMSAFKKHFSFLGGEVVGEYRRSINDLDVRADLIKAKNSGSEAVLDLLATGAPLGEPIKQSKELGFDFVWLGAMGTENAPFLKEYGSLAEGMVYPYPFDDSNLTITGKHFWDSFIQKYGEAPDSIASNSYDAVMLIAEGIKVKGENPIGVKEYLLSVKDYKGVSGVISFDQNGDVIKPVIIKTIYNNSFVPYDTN